MVQENFFYLYRTFSEYLVPTGARLGNFGTSWVYSSCTHCPCINTTLLSVSCSRCTICLVCLSRMIMVLVCPTEYMTTSVHLHSSSECGAMDPPCGRRSEYSISTAWSRWGVFIHSANFSSTASSNSTTCVGYGVVLCGTLLYTYGSLLGW